MHDRRSTVAMAASNKAVDAIDDDFMSAAGDLYVGASTLYDAKFYSKDNAAFVKDALETIYNATEEFADYGGIDNPIMLELQVCW